MKSFNKPIKLLILAVIIGIIAFSPLKDILRNANVPDRIRELGDNPWAPLIYAGFYTVGVLLAVPGLPMTVMAGVLFGFGMGTLVTVVGANLGTQLTFVVSRFFGSDLAGFLTKRYPYLGLLDKKLRQNGFRVMVTLRLLPVVPFNAINYLAGLTGISYRDYSLGNLLGMLPGSMLYVYFGASAINTDNPAGIILSVVLLVIFTLVGAFVKKRSGLMASAQNEQLPQEAEETDEGI